jgi:hypothetical protein
MNKFLILGFVIFQSFILKAQNDRISNEKFIYSFLEDIFLNNNISSERLYKKYVIGSNKIKRKKLKFFEANLIYLKENNPCLEKPHIFSKIEVHKYSSSPVPDKLLSFDTRALHKIYVINKGMDVISYVLIEDFKIKAFNFIQKGTNGPAFFVNNF